MVGGSDFAKTRFNRAVQARRQPGSAFKPFVLTTAVNEGIDPDSTTYPAPSSVTLNPDAYTTWTVSGACSPPCFRAQARPTSSRSA